jgi:hypothetical protein
VKFGCSIAYCGISGVALVEREQEQKLTVNLTVNCLLIDQFISAVKHHDDEQWDRQVCHTGRHAAVLALVLPCWLL